MESFGWEGLQIEEYILKKGNKAQRRARGLFLSKKEEVLGLLLEQFRDTGGRFPTAEKVDMRDEDEKVRKDIWTCLSHEKFLCADYTVFLAYKGGHLIGMFCLACSIADASLGFKSQHLRSLFPSSIGPPIKKFYPKFEVSKAALLSNHCVRPAYQKRGAGSALIRLARERANQLGKQLFGFLDPQIRKNIEDYRRRGAVIHEEDLGGLGYPFVFP